MMLVQTTLLQLLLQLLVVALVTCDCVAAVAATGDDNESDSDSSALVWRQGHETVSIEPWGPDGVRVRATLGRGNIGEPPIGALLPLADALKCARPARRVIVDEAGVQSLPPPATSVISGALNATISSAGQLIFTRTDTGAELLREHYPLHGKPGREYSALARGTGGRLMRVAQSFTSPRNETIYGLGQQLNGMLDQKGVGVELDQFNTQVRHPFDTHAAVQPACP
jgi:alpha-D-xyloside xylohydrolase